MHRLRQLFGLSSTGASVALGDSDGTRHRFVLDVTDQPGVAERNHPRRDRRKQPGIGPRRRRRRRQTTSQHRRQLQRRHRNRGDAG